MKPTLFKLTTIAATCAAMSTPVFSQAPTQPAPGTPVAQAVMAQAAGPQTVAAAAVRITEPASVRRFTAAGSVIILADGIVANATVAQIRPPAPGFVYER